MQRDGQRFNPFPPLFAQIRHKRARNAASRLAAGCALAPNAAMSTTYHTLHQACAAHGTRLFTVSVQDLDLDVARRAYTSHPVEYPVSGTKPLTRDGWYAACITAQKTFVANTTPEFAKYFFDHALITSLGLGSCINIPLVENGAVLGTINLLAEEHHFTPERLAAYEALVVQHHDALAAEMAKG
jgi:hypothetical protein